MVRNAWIRGTGMALVIAAFGCAAHHGDAGKDARSLYITEHPEIQVKYAEAILQGTVLIGMTRDMVHAAWGEPARREQTAGDLKGDEKWTYGNYWVTNEVTLLYFKQDQLVLYELVANNLTSVAIKDPNERLTLRSRARNDESPNKGRP